MSDANTTDAEPETPMPVQTRAEYMQQLAQWIQDVQKQNMATFAMWNCHLSQMHMNMYPPTSHPTQSANARPQPTPATNVPAFREYVIPPMWRRLVAEFIDFLILLIIKMFLTIMLLESFDLFELQNYGFNSLHKKFQNPKLAMQMSYELLTLEILHRIIVCCYESYWLCTSQHATPGKKCMGLAVVNATHINHVPGRFEETVNAYPCTVLSIKSAVFRAVLKNVFVSLLLPICFVLLFFKYNRTGYDMITNSLVVQCNEGPAEQRPN